MNRRTKIKEVHERAVLRDFLDWYNSKHNLKFEIIEEPDPPEAIVKSGDRTTWIEVVDVFLSGEYARDEYSYATPGETHIPMDPGPYVNMDEAFANHFVKVIQDKLTKKSYLTFKEQYGPGILVMGMRSPFFDQQTVDMMRPEYQMEEWSHDLGCFREIYIMASGFEPLLWER